MSTECLYLIDSLTTKLSSEVSLQAHLQQITMDSKQLGSAVRNNGQSNGYANGHANGHVGRYSVHVLQNRGQAQ